MKIFIKISNSVKIEILASTQHSGCQVLGWTLLSISQLRDWLSLQTKLATFYLDLQSNYNDTTSNLNICTDVYYLLLPGLILSKLFLVARNLTEQLNIRWDCPPLVVTTNDTLSMGGIIEKNISINFTK